MYSNVPPIQTEMFTQEMYYPIKSDEQLDSQATRHLSIAYADTQYTHSLPMPISLREDMSETASKT